MRLLGIIRQTRTTVNDARLHRVLDNIRAAVVKKMTQPALNGAASAEQAVTQPLIGTIDDLNIASDKIELDISAPRASVLLGLLATLVGIYLVVFSPMPTVAGGKDKFVPMFAALDRVPKVFYYHPRWQRYYRRTWPPGVAIAAAGVASTCVGLYLGLLSRPALRATVGGREGKCQLAHSNTHAIDHGVPC